MENLACAITSFELKAADGGKEGVVVARAAVFGRKDLDDDIFERGAFKASLAARPEIPMMIGHGSPGNRDDSICGVWDKNREDNEGLLLEGRFALKTTKGREAMELVEMKALQGLSVGHIVEEREYKAAGDGRVVRHIGKSSVFHCGWTHTPAQPESGIISLKSQLARLEKGGQREEAEMILRREGFGDAELKALFGGGADPAPENDAADWAVAIAASSERIKQLGA